jgi:hypothetical protein
MRFLKLFDFHGGKILFLSFTYSNFFLIVSIIILNHLYLLFCKLYVQLYYIILYYIINNNSIMNFFVYYIQLCNSHLIKVDVD